MYCSVPVAILPVRHRGEPVLYSSTGTVLSGCVLLVGLDGCEVRLCGLCAFVRPRVPCVPSVSRLPLLPVHVLPPVSFYRYYCSMDGGVADTSPFEL